jgi:hypothetical protein
MALVIAGPSDARVPSPRGPSRPRVGSKPARHGVGGDRARRRPSEPTRHCCPCRKAGVSRHRRKQRRTSDAIEPIGLPSSSRPRTRRRHTDRAASRQIGADIGLAATWPLPTIYAHALTVSSSPSMRRRRVSSDTGDAPAGGSSWSCSNETRRAGSARQPSLGRQTSDRKGDIRPTVRYSPSHARRRPKRPPPGDIQRRIAVYPFGGRTDGGRAPPSLGAGVQPAGPPLRQSGV